MRLRLTALIVTLALGLLAGPLPVEAQEAGEDACNLMVSLNPDHSDSLSEV